MIVARYKLDVDWGFLSFMGFLESGYLDVETRAVFYPCFLAPRLVSFVFTLCWLHDGHAIREEFCITYNNWFTIAEASF